MSYVFCPDCKKKFSNKVIYYETELEKIENSKKSTIEKNKDKKDLLQKIDITRYCCAVRIMSSFDQINIIK